MTRVQIISLVSVVAVVVMLKESMFRVQETDQVLITEFGEIIGDAIDLPGLHFKVPFIQKVNRFDKRWLEWDGDANQITTRDKRYIHIDTYARWRIGNPLLFFQRLRNERSAQSRLDDIIDGATRNVVANHDLIEIVRTTNRSFREDEIIAPGAEATPTTEPDTKGQSQNDQNYFEITKGRQKLTRMILANARPKAELLGIDLVDVQIKRINYIASVQKKVFERMISERKRVAEAYRSKGQGLAAEIKGKKSKELKGITSAAYRKSQEIKGAADAEAAAIYAKAYNVDPELYRFLKTLDSYEQTMDAQTWLVLGTDADYARFLRTMGGPE
jgi:membrane protease subunit HflC